MAEQIVPANPVSERWRDYIRPSGTILATDVSYEDFMAGFPNMRAEWVDGVVIEMPGIDDRHDELSGFLRILLDAYLSLTGGGRVFQDPMLMRLPNVPSLRAPDVQVLLPNNLDKRQKNEVVGAADLVIEIVSTRSRRIDTYEKVGEYERGGVKEYWVIDPQRKFARFYVLNDDELFDEQPADDAGTYRSSILPQLHFAVDLLWRDELPHVPEALALVQAMLAKEDNS
jgi:Uma2 family endonuclease